MLFVALAEGRVRLTSIVLLGPHLNADNVEELLACVRDKDTLEIRRFLAERFLRVSPALIPCERDGGEANEIESAAQELSSVRPMTGRSGKRD